MQVTKQQILNGTAKYMREEMVPRVTDKGFRAILEALAAIVEMSPRALDSLFDNPMLAAILRDEEGLYDLDIAEAALVRAAEAAGGLTLTVPAIPLISPGEKALTFSANDIRNMKRYITGQ